MSASAGLGHAVLQKPAATAAMAAGLRMHKLLKLLKVWQQMAAQVRP